MAPKKLNGTFAIENSGGKRKKIQPSFIFHVEVHRKSKKVYAHRKPAHTFCSPYSLQKHP